MLLEIRNPEFQRIGYQQDRQQENHQGCKVFRIPGQHWNLSKTKMR